MNDTRNEDKATFLEVIGTALVYLNQNKDSNAYGSELMAEARRLRSGAAGDVEALVAAVEQMEPEARRAFELKLLSKHWNTIEANHRLEDAEARIADLENLLRDIKRWRFSPAEMEANRGLTYRVRSEEWGDLERLLASSKDAKKTACRCPHPKPMKAGEPHKDHCPLSPVYQLLEATKRAAQEKALSIEVKLYEAACFAGPDGVDREKFIELAGELYDNRNSDAASVVAGFAAMRSKQLEDEDPRGKPPPEPPKLLGPVDAFAKKLVEALRAQFGDDLARSAYGPIAGGLVKLADRLELKDAP